MLTLALYQPDIPQNVGAVMRLCACMGVGLDVIEPCGFPWDEKKIKTSALDYRNHIDVKRHSDWASFREHYAGRRIILMTTKTDMRYTDFVFQDGDILLAGSESSGVPAQVHQEVSSAITIPMASAMRSLNIGMSCAMVIGEAVRQIG